jgi:head-tail adaptor
MNWKLDRVITIEQYTVTPDAMGQEVKVWATWKTCYAEKVEAIATYRKEEDYLKNQLVAEAAVAWKIRNIGVPTTLMRVIDDLGTIYDIERVDEIGRRQGWQLKTRRKE